MGYLNVETSYYVLGYLSTGGGESKIILLSSKAFASEAEARAYAETCHAAYRAFVVEEM